MEFWIDGWVSYFLGLWDNATVTDYLTLIVGVVIIGSVFNFCRNSVR